jgi:hypothetical protein
MHAIQLAALLLGAGTVAFLVDLANARLRRTIAAVERQLDDSR